MPLVIEFDIELVIPFDIVVDEVDVLLIESAAIADVQITAKAAAAISFFIVVFPI